MKFPLFLLGVLSSLVVNAEVIKLHDGTVAKCENLVDVSSHSLSGVYRPVSVKRNEGSAVVALEFLTCVKENNKYAFKRDANFEDKIVNPIVAPDKSIQIERKNISILVLDDSGKLIDKKKLIKTRDNLYKAEVSLPAERLEFHVQALYKMTDLDNGSEIDQGTAAYGAFRFK